MLDVCAAVAVAVASAREFFPARHRLYRVCARRLCVRVRMIGRPVVK